MKKKRWKKAMFYICRELIRWAVMLAGTLAVLIAVIAILEDPDGRLFFYLTVAIAAALGFGNILYGRKEKHGRKTTAVGRLVETGRVSAAGNCRNHKSA